MVDFIFDDDSLLWIEEVDRQRQQVIHLLELVYVRTAMGETIEDLLVVVDGLAEYATAHFTWREHLLSMSLKNDPAEHLDEYHVFMRLYDEIHKAYYCGTAVSLDTISAISNQLIYHRAKIEESRRLHASAEPSTGTVEAPCRPLRE